MWRSRSNVKRSGALILTFGIKANIMKKPAEVPTNHLKAVFCHENSGRTALCPTGHRPQELSCLQIPSGELVLRKIHPEHRTRPRRPLCRALPAQRDGELQDRGFPGHLLGDPMESSCFGGLPSSPLCPSGGAVLPAGEGLRQKRCAGSHHPRPGGIGADGLSSACRGCHPAFRGGLSR